MKQWNISPMVERLDVNVGVMTRISSLMVIGSFSMSMLMVSRSVLKDSLGLTALSHSVMLLQKIGNFMCKENKIEPFYAGITINGKYTQGMVYPEYKENGTVQYWMSGVGFVPWANLRRLSE